MDVAGAKGAWGVEVRGWGRHGSGSSQTSNMNDGWVGRRARASWQKQTTPGPRREQKASFIKQSPGRPPLETAKRA
eukprot:3624618-Lingulodinium_polyedra.AAC.1